MNKNLEVLDISTQFRERFGSETCALEHHAATSRTDVAAWLSLMDEHVRKGDITPEGLRRVVDMIGTRKASELFQILETEFPNATNVFMYLRINAIHSLFANEPRLVWPARYPLDGLSLDVLGATSYFRGADLSEARIAFGIDREGMLISLEEDALTVPKHDIWERGTQIVDTCKNAELFFQTAFSGKSVHQRATPYMGVILTDQGKPVACIKFDGIDSMLALRTVRQDDGTKDFTRGIIYALGNRTYGFITDVAERIRKADSENGRLPAYGDHVWLTADIRELAAQGKAAGYSFDKNLMRFIANDSQRNTREHIYPLMDDFVERIERGELTVRQLLEVS